MTKLLSFLSLLTAATGCGNCMPVALTPDERAWVSPYQSGQQLHFRSNRGATNVLTALPLREWFENQNCNMMEAGKYQPISTLLALNSTTRYSKEGDGSFSLTVHKITPDHPARLSFALSGLLGQDLAAPASPARRWFSRTLPWPMAATFPKHTCCVLAKVRPFSGAAANCGPAGGTSAPACCATSWPAAKCSTWWPIEPATPASAPSKHQRPRRSPRTRRSYK